MENSISILDRHGKPLPAVRRRGAMLAPGGNAPLTQLTSTAATFAIGILISPRRTVRSICTATAWRRGHET